ncbi:MAG: hypothetical protein H6855_00735 [Rhodospirillales bacterium]|nr:hypothetical protein [Rhodospirillales bacterium]MCB9964594.1 hypothetical protein [Rhodospirillales bacterium]
MASFNIIEVSGQAYLKVWEERHYILKLALWPLIAKIIFFAAVMGLGLENNVLRQTIVLLPAYFFEGWFLVLLVRFVFFKERLDGVAEAKVLLEERGRDMFAGILFYVLIKMAQNALLAPLLETEQQAQSVGQDIPDPSLLTMMAALSFFLLVIWLFKMAFLYIPVAAGIPVGRYLRIFPGLSGSLSLIGAWLMCYIPFLLVGVMILEVFSPGLWLEGNALVFFVFTVRFLVELAASSVITVCFALILQEILFGKPKSK